MMVLHNGCHFYLMNDIDLEYDLLQGLFSNDNPFNSTLDGKKFTLKNISNTAPIIASVGENGVIKNLYIDNISKLAEGYGILTNYNYGKIESCKITNGNASKAQSGFIAYDNYGVIKGCTVRGAANGTTRFHDVGGIAVVNKSTGKILNCKSSVNIAIGAEWTLAKHKLGGIVASNEGTIVACSSSGEYGCIDTFRGRSLDIGAIAAINSGTVQVCSCTGAQTKVKLVGAGNAPTN